MEQTKFVASIAPGMDDLYCLTLVDFKVEPNQMEAEELKKILSSYSIKEEMLRPREMKSDSLQIINGSKEGAQTLKNNAND